MDFLTKLKHDFEVEQVIANIRQPLLLALLRKVSSRTVVVISVKERWRGLLPLLGVLALLCWSHWV